MLSMSSKFEIKELKQKTAIFISANITRENGIYLVKKALKFDSKDIIKRAIQTVAKNFAYIYDTNYNFLPYDLFLSLVEHDFLNVVREFNLYDKIIMYIREHNETL